MQTSTSIKETSRQGLTLASTGGSNPKLTESASRSYCACITGAISEKWRGDQKVWILENLELLETGFSSFLPRDLGIFDFRKNSWLLHSRRCVLQILSTLPANFAVNGCAASRINRQWERSCQELCCLWKSLALLANTEDLGNLSNVISSKQHEFSVQLGSEIKCQSRKLLSFTLPRAKDLFSRDMETSALRK